jgi:excisionase family DNA binding protein
MNLADLRTCQDAALTVTAVAGLLHLDERTVRRACDEGDLPCLKVGRRLLIPTEPLRHLLCLNTPDMSADPATTGPSTATTHQDFGGPSNAQNTALRSA